MNTLRFEKTMIALGMTLMEASGMVLLICGILDIRLF